MPFSHLLGIKLHHDCTFGSLRRDSKTTLNLFFFADLLHHPSVCFTQELLSFPLSEALANLLRACLNCLSLSLCSGAMISRTWHHHSWSAHQGSHWETKAGRTCGVGVGQAYWLKGWFTRWRESSSQMLLNTMNCFTSGMFYLMSLDCGWPLRLGRVWSGRSATWTVCTRQSSVQGIKEMWRLGMVHVLTKLMNVIFTSDISWGIMTSVI